MKSLHITESILDACLRGKISSDTLLRRILRHLQNRCEVCYKEMAKWRQRRQFAVSSSALLQAVLDEQVPPLGDEAEANRDLLTLLPLEVPERERKVERALSRFRSPLLARALTQEAIGELGHDLEEASSLSELALLVLEHAPISNFSREVKAHTLAFKAMVSKNRGELGAAEELFSQARSLVSHTEIVDLILAGELDEMQGSFLKDRRELERAETLLGKAMVRYKILDDDERQARTLLVLAHVKYHLERYEEAVSDACIVLELSPDRKDYTLIATHNIILYLADAGRFEEAAEQLKASQDRYNDAQPVWRLCDLHFHWVAGRISYGLGRFQQAEVHLSKARDGFSDRGTVYDTVLVCLDLALVYEALGKNEDLLELMSIISGELAGNALHRESSAAVALFIKAAARKSVSDELVRSVSRFLQFSRTDPTLKCELSPKTSA